MSAKGKPDVAEHDAFHNRFCLKLHFKKPFPKALQEAQIKLACSCGSCYARWVDRNAAAYAAREPDLEAETLAMEHGIFGRSEGVANTPASNAEPENEVAAVQPCSEAQNSSSATEVSGQSSDQTGSSSQAQSHPHSLSPEEIRALKAESAFVSHQTASYAKSSLGPLPFPPSSSFAAASSLKYEDAMTPTKRLTKRSHASESTPPCVEPFTPEGAPPCVTESRAKPKAKPKAKAAARDWWKCWVSGHRF